MNLTLATVAVAQHLNDHPDDEHWAYKIHQKVGLRTGAISPVLMRMQEAGWIAGGWDIPPGGGTPRYLYTVTNVGRRQIAAYLARAAGDARFTHLLGDAPPQDMTRR